MSATPVEVAILAWAAAGSGLPATHVIWDEQGGNRPTGQYITVNTLSLLRQGHDGVVVEDNPDSSGSDGEEILLVARGARVLVLSIQCRGGSPVGTTSPMARLERLASMSELPPVAEILTDAGLGLADFGAVRRVGGVVNTSTWEPRAVAGEVRLHVGSEVSVTGTYIEIIESNGEIFPL